MCGEGAGRHAPREKTAHTGRGEDTLFSTALRGEPPPSGGAAARDGAGQGCVVHRHRQRRRAGTAPPLHACPPGTLPLFTHFAERGSSFTPPDRVMAIGRVMYTVMAALTTVVARTGGRQGRRLVVRACWIAVVARGGRGGPQQDLRNEEGTAIEQGK